MVVTIYISIIINTKIYSLAPLFMLISRKIIRKDSGWQEAGSVLIWTDFLNKKGPRFKLGPNIAKARLLGFISDIPFLCA